MVPAGMAFLVALVMAALDVRLEHQLLGQQVFHSLVRAAGHAAIQLDACLVQGRAGAAANAAARCV